MKEITKAILSVMQEVKNIEKTMDVGTGHSTYKGVSDKIVKEVLQPAMVKNGLAIVPTSVEAKATTERWGETTNYNNVPQTKQKQSTLTEVTTKYLLIHSSGESIELAGYGQGVDSQDKGAGKATTYALKYTLLYTFLIPTGKIDDADNEHSDDIEVPKVNRNNNDEL